MAARTVPSKKSSKYTRHTWQMDNCQGRLTVVTKKMDKYGVAKMMMGITVDVVSNVNIKTKFF